MSHSAVGIIQKKKRKQSLTAEEITWLIHSYAADKIPDYQMAAWAMAVYFNGMDENEIAAFTAAMRDSGDKFDFEHLQAPRIDKHSTGGVGDKTSLIIGPIWAAAQIYTPMIAGRGLGHTGGTLDKLESIPGFSVQLEKRQFEKNIETHFFSLMGQTKEICPADRKLYALRDVTATVDSLPLICGSIMSKKLAEDITGLVLDVKFGSGAFMKTVEDAEALARLLQATGKKNGVRVHALLTSMEQPLGRFAGNALEVKECIDVLSGSKDYPDTHNLSVELAAHGILLAEKATDLEQARQIATSIVESGKALEAFTRWLDYQGPSNLAALPTARQTKDIFAKESGYLGKMDCEKLGWACVHLGAGRFKTDDQIDPTAGLEFKVKLGQPVAAGEPLARMYANDSRNFSLVERILLESLCIQAEPLENDLPLIAKVLT